MKPSILQACYYVLFMTTACC